MQKTPVGNMRYHIQAIYKIIFKVDYFLLMGFNEQMGEVNHKTLYTGMQIWVNGMEVG